MSHSFQVITPTQDRHIGQVCDLWRERQTILHQSDGRFLALNSEQEADFRNLISQRLAGDGIVRVGLRDNTVVGYITGTMGEGLGVIDGIALDAHTYHAGLGRALWQAIKLEFEARAAQKIVIIAPRYHAVEQAFWRALGAKTWMPDPDYKLCNLSPEFMWMIL